MTYIAVKLSTQELELLTSLVSDQLFRREFIDPRMPGYRSNSAELSMGKALLERLRSTANPGYGKRTAAARMTG